MADIVIEFPSVGETYNNNEAGVYKYDEYPRHSVLAGQTRRSLIDTFPTVEEAKANYPKADVMDGSAYAPAYIPQDPPEWFDPSVAGESWAYE
jgi:hypothetical protein